MKEVLEAQPALVLIAGDFVYQADSTQMMQAADLIRPLTDARIPVVAVFGNHDYGMMGESDEPQVHVARHLRSRLEATGLLVIENESVRIRTAGGGPPLHVVGLGSVWVGRSRPLTALAQLPVDAPRLVLMHNPVSFLELPPQAAPLALAAHTHGGQICVPYTPSKSWLRIARSHEVIADGWAKDSIGAPGNRLYVNRGIGFSLVPRRLSRPKLTLFTLRRANRRSEKPGGGRSSLVRTARNRCGRRWRLREPRAVPPLDEDYGSASSTPGNIVRLKGRMERRSDGAPPSIGEKS